MFCPKCGTEVLDESAFCHNCGAMVGPPTESETGPAGPPRERKGISTTIALVAVAAGIATLLVVGVLVLEPFGDGGGSGGGLSPEYVARRAVQALIDGDGDAYLREIRADNREFRSDSSESRHVRDLDGCDVGRAEVLAEEVSRSGTLVTFVFDQPCGENVFGYNNASCRVEVTKLSDRWYLEADNLNCSSSGQEVSEETGGESGTPAHDPRVAGLTPDDTISVNVNDVNYSRTEISANAGEVIELLVTNTGTISHNLVVAGLDDEYDTADDFEPEPFAIQPGETGRVVVKIDNPGTYLFRCAFHPNFEFGTLILR